MATSMRVQLAIQKFREQERTRHLLEKKEHELLQRVAALSSEEEVAEYHAETQKIIDEYDRKSQTRGY